MAPLPSSSPPAVLYHPTQLEEAYALYLLEQELGIPPLTLSTGSSNNNNGGCDNNNDAHFRISGRQAVPFLTKSGLDRVLLRTFWTIADPQNVGTLTHQSQIHVLLRLIAMTQAGVVTNSSSNTAESVSTIHSLLHQWASHPLPLPTFQGVMIPEAAFLMTTYWAKTLAVQPLANPGPPVSISDAFGDLPTLDAPLPPLVVEPVAIVGVVADVAASTDAMPPAAMDIPNTTTMDFSIHGCGMVQTNGNTDDDEFGNFESVIEPSSTIITSATIDSIMPIPNFGSETASPPSWTDDTKAQSFYSAQESLGLGRLDSSSSITGAVAVDDQQNRNEDGDMDEFGDFEDAPQEDSTGTPLPVVMTSSTIELTTTFLPSAEHSGMFVPPHATMVGSGLSDNVVQGGAFGSFPTAGSCSTTNVDPEEDPFSAFDALAPPPIPLTPSFEMEHPSSTAMEGDDGESGTPNEHGDEEEGDDFGDFEAAEATDVEQESTNPNPTIIDHSVGTRELEIQHNLEGTDEMSSESEVTDFAAVTTATTTSLPSTVATDPDDPFSAFDALSPPLPSLGVRPTPVESEEHGNGTTEADTFPPEGQNDEIDAGESGVRSASTPDESLGALPESQQPIATFASSDSEELTTDDLYAAFDTISPPKNEALQSAEAHEITDPSANDTAPVSSWGMGSIPETSVVLTAGLDNDDDDPFSAFDALAAPPPELPPLASFSLAVSASEPVAPWNENEVVEPETGLAEIGSQQEPPLALHVVEPANEKHEMGVEEDDDFGDFMFVENPSAATSATTTHADLDAQPKDSIPQVELVSPTGANVFDIMDDFGSFTAAGTQASGVAETGQIDVVPNQPPGEVDLFDIFLSSTPQMSPPITSNDVGPGHDFGDFSVAVVAPLEARQEQLSVEQPQAEGVEDDFEGHAASDLPVHVGSTQVESNHEGAFQADEHDFGDFSDAVIPMPQPEHQNNNFNTSAERGARPGSVVVEDEFGAFDGPTATDPVTSEGTSTVDNKQTFAVDEHDDEFGDFEAVGAFSDPEPENNAAVEDEIFGDFDAFRQVEPNRPSNDGATETFGDFGGVVEATANNIPTETSPEDDKWGAFHDTPTSVDTPKNIPESEVTKINDLVVDEDSIRQFLALIRTWSPHLPSRIVGPADETANIENFISQVEANVRALKPRDKHSIKRMRRCADVMLKLSSTHSKLALTSWNQILTIVRDELTLGVSILEEAISLSPRDLALLREQLRVMVGGLAEYMRVCRSIVATIGDLLCLAPSTSLTEQNWPLSWCSISLLELALESEQMYKSLQLAVLSLRIGEAVTSRKLESVSEIRSNCLQLLPSDRLCQLTLHPLAANDKSTKSEVVWEGKSYHAGAANLWANRVSIETP